MAVASALFVGFFGLARARVFWWVVWGFFSGRLAALSGWMVLRAVCCGGRRAWLGLGWRVRPALPLVVLLPFPRRSAPGLLWPPSRFGFGLVVGPAGFWGVLLSARGVSFAS